MAFALTFHGFCLPASISAETPKTLSCIKLETLIEANEQDFATFQKRNRIDEDTNAGEAIATMAVFLFTGLIVSSWEPGAPEEFNRLQDKNEELRKQALRENCNVPTSMAPWKTVHEMFNPPYEPDPPEDNP